MLSQFMGPLFLFFFSGVCQAISEKSAKIVLVIGEFRFWLKWFAWRPLFYKNVMA